MSATFVLVECTTWDVSAESPTDCKLYKAFNCYTTEHQMTAQSAQHNASLKSVSEELHASIKIQAVAKLTHLLCKKKKVLANFK